MTTQALTALLHAHNLPARVVGGDVVTEDRYVDARGRLEVAPKVFPALTPCVVVLAWLGY